MTHVEESRLCQRRTGTERWAMRQVEVAVIGTGWCGGIRAETLSRSALVDKLHICEIRPDRLAEVKALTKPATATLDYQDIIRNPDISVVYISTTPESNHLPDRPRLPAGGQARLARKADRAGTVGSGRTDRAGPARQPQIHHRLFAALQPKFAYAKKKIADGTLGNVVVNVMVSRHISRGLGKKIGHARQALAGGDGIDARPRFRVLAAGAGEARARLFAGRLRRTCRTSTAPSIACGRRSPWTTARWW